MYTVRKLKKVHLTNETLNAKLLSMRRTHLSRDAVCSGPAFGRSADDTASSLSSSVASSPSVSKRLSGSSSIPDLTKLDVYERRDDTPQHIIRVYRADQTFKHLLIHKVSFLDLDPC